MKYLGRSEIICHTVLVAKYFEINLINSLSLECFTQELVLSFATVYVPNKICVSLVIKMRLILFLRLIHFLQLPKENANTITDICLLLITAFIHFLIFLCGVQYSKNPYV